MRPASLIKEASTYFMKNHNRMMMGIGTPTSHRRIERILQPLIEMMMLRQRLRREEGSYSPASGQEARAAALGCQTGL